MEFKSCTQNDTTVNGDEVRQPPDEPDITPGPTGVDPSAPASHHTASYARTHADQGQPAFPASTTRRRRNASWLHEWCRSEKKQAFDRNGQPTTATWFTCPHCGAELQGTGNAGDHVGRLVLGWYRPPNGKHRHYKCLDSGCDRQFDKDASIKSLAEHAWRAHDFYKPPYIASPPCKRRGSAHSSSVDVCTAEEKATGERDATELRGHATGTTGPALSRMPLHPRALRNRPLPSATAQSPLCAIPSSSFPSSTPMSPFPSPFPHTFFSPSLLPVDMSGLQEPIDGQAEPSAKRPRRTILDTSHVAVPPSGHLDLEVMTSDGIPCDARPCLSGGKAPLWRYHCRTCAERLINYNLCPECHSSRGLAILRLSADDTLDPAYHHITHEFAYIYNIHRPVKQCSQRALALLRNLIPAAITSFSPDDPSQACRPLIRLMYLLGVVINELAALTNYHEWSALQQRADPHIDLAHFYHHSRDHEYLVLLFWCGSNMFDKLDGADLTLGQQFLAASGLQQLASLPDDQSSQMLLIHLKEAVLHATQQRLHIQVTSFDFSYLGLLISAMVELRPVFARQELQDVLALITDQSSSYWPYYTQLNNLVMYLIDSQPAEQGLQSALLRALYRCGLPRRAGVEQDGRGANVTEIVGEHLFQLHLIAQQYHLVCKWRMCRLQLAFYCQRLLRLLVPKFTPQALLGLSEAQQELVRFLDMAYRALRPRQPFLMFEHDRKVVLDVLGSGMGCSSRLLLFLQQLLSSTSISYHDKGSRSVQLQDTLRQLVALFIFVLRGRADDQIEQVLSDAVWHALPAQKEELASVVTLTERWTTGASVSAEVIRVLGGEQYLATAVPGGWEFPLLPVLFPDRLPRSLRAAGDLPHNWMALTWYNGPPRARSFRARYNVGRGSAHSLTTAADPAHAHGDQTLSVVSVADCSVSRQPSMCPSSPSPLSNAILAWSDRWPSLSNSRTASIPLSFSVASPILFS